MTYQALQDILKFAEDENKKGNFDAAEQLLQAKLQYLEAQTQSIEVQENQAHLRIALAQNAWYRGNYEAAPVHARAAIDIVNTSQQPDSTKYLIHAKGFNIIGLVNWNVSNFTKALEFYTKAIEAAEKINERAGIAMITGNMGIVYSKLEDFSRAYDYYTKALAVHEELGMKREAANVTCNLGILYRTQEDFPLALEYFTKALTAHEELGMKTEAARMMGNIGTVYFSINQFSLALEYYRKALAEFEKLNLDVDIAIIYGHLGGLYAHNDFEAYNPDTAIEYLHKAIEIDENLGLKQDLYENHETLAKIYKEKEDWQKFAHHFTLFHEIEGKVNSEESMRLAQRLAIQHDIALIQREQEILKEKNAELSVLNSELETKNEQLLLLNIEKNEFLGIASHDLKNPLSSITMLANALAHDARQLTYEEIEDMAEDIRTSSKRMYELILNLLDVNKIEQGNVFTETEVFSVGDFTRASVEHHTASAQNKGITLEAKIEETSMESSPILYTQILDNLISNAVKFSKSDTTVRITVQRLENTVRISVHDQGPGLTEDDKSKLFKKFSRLSAQPTGGELSTGLGLSIVKKLVEAMNGTIWCESTPGEGATFVVEFPAYEG